MYDFGIENVKLNNPLPDVMIRYGVRINNKGMAVCPFHNDKNGSMKVYKNNTYHCFGCGADGDCIDFVRQMENCDFKTAYHLLGGVDRTLTAEEKKRYREEMKAREREVKRKEAVKESIRKIENIHSALCVQIRHVSDGLTHLTDDFWDELAMLEKCRLKCEIKLCKLREIL